MSDSLEERYPGATNANKEEREAAYKEYRVS